MRLLTNEEIEISDKLCNESETLTEEEINELKNRLKEINEEQTNGITWIT